jgi:hypothetical protein
LANLTREDFSQAPSPKERAGRGSNLPVDFCNIGDAVLSVPAAKIGGPNKNLPKTTKKREKYAAKNAVRSPV